MQTVEEFILRNEIEFKEKVAEKWQKAGLGQKTIDLLKQEIKIMKEKGMKIGGDQELLKVEYIKHEVKKGRGGKQYLLINDEIKYFPDAKYGKFISK